MYSVQAKKYWKIVLPSGLKNSDGEDAPALYTYTARAYTLLHPALALLLQRLLMWTWSCRVCIQDELLLGRLESH